MAWIQKRDANWRVPYTGGWCLKYVQDAFGSDHPYPHATAAWQANYGGKNHTDLPPVGKTCAVYFSLGSEPMGHVAIHLDDGMVASSTQGGVHPQGYIHPNMQHMINLYGQYNGGCKYLGWSEYCGTVKTLVWEETKSVVVTTPILHDTVKQKDDTLEVGKTTTIDGKDGERKITYTVTLNDGIEVRRVVASDVTTPAVATIINEGTKIVGIDTEMDKETNAIVKDNNTILKQILKIITDLWNKITSIFK